MTRSLALALVCLALPAAVLADGLPDPATSTVTIATSGRVMLRVHPDGRGPSFTAAYGEGGSVVDATVTMQVFDTMGYPVAGFPYEDMWLASTTAGLVTCGGAPGLTPDGNTDVFGETQWTYPPRAGGHTDGHVAAFINGQTLLSAPLDMFFTSPDINGDGRVDLSDGGYLSGDLFGTYARKSDFNWDGVINVSDVGVMAQALGSGCP